MDLPRLLVLRVLCQLVGHNQNEKKEKGDLQALEN
jgi:hypothetical protein